MLLKHAAKIVWIGKTNHFRDGVDGEIIAFQERFCATDAIVVEITNGRSARYLFENTVHIIRGNVDQLCKLVLTGNGSVILMDVVANNVNVGCVGMVLRFVKVGGVEREQTPKPSHHKAVIVLRKIT